MWAKGKKIKKILQYLHPSMEKVGEEGKNYEYRGDDRTPCGDWVICCNFLDV